MFEFATITICIMTIILLKIFLNVNFKGIKNIEIKETEELIKLSKKFPKDEKICKDILKKLNNENVKIKIEPEYNTCIYTVYNNTITIGEFAQNYMKLQTLAHECIHACQSKRTLWGNFIFSNLYLIYFVIVLALTFFNKVPFTNVHIVILILTSVIQYIIRFALENEAMLKAKYIAKEYIEENKLLNNKEEEILLQEYDRVNKIGIPFMNFYLISVNLVKVVLYAMVCII